MEVGLSPFVRYDDYDGYGYLLDIRHGVLEELNERDTCILSTILRSETRAEALHSLSRHIRGENLETDASALLERLERHQFLESQASEYPIDAPYEVKLCNSAVRPFHPTTLRQRIVGAGHIVFILNELRQKDDGFFRAYQSIQKGKGMMCILSPEAALRVVREEYWWYRIITGLLERRIAHLLGQVPGEEGLCMVRAFALCAYLLTLGVPAQMIIARPRYGSRSGFKLHVWVELNGKPLNEAPNIRERYRVIDEFPFLVR
jgi:hypothetical protein